MQEKMICIQAKSSNMHITLLGAHVPSNINRLVTKLYVNCNSNPIH